MIQEMITLVKNTDNHMEYLWLVNQSKEVKVKKNLSKNIS